MSSNPYLSKDQVLVPLLEPYPLVPRSSLHAHIKSIPQFRLLHNESKHKHSAKAKPSRHVEQQNPISKKPHLECVLGGALRWDGGDELRLGGSPGGVALGLVGEHPSLLDDILR